MSCDKPPRKEGNLKVAHAVIYLATAASSVLIPDLCLLPIYKILTFRKPQQCNWDDWHSWTIEMVGMSQEK